MSSLLKIMNFGLFIHFKLFINKLCITKFIHLWFSYAFDILPQMTSNQPQ